MWVNSLYEVNEKDQVLDDFIARNELSIFVTHSPVLVSYMPIQHVLGTNNSSKIVFHMPKADPMSAVLASGSRLSVLILGPQQYISPNYYLDAGLPTFNYGVAELEGECHKVPIAELRDHLMHIISHRERLFSQQTRTEPWQLSAEAHERFELLLTHLVGFEMFYDRLDVKVKMGQNRSAADVNHTICCLEQHEFVSRDALRMMREFGAPRAD